MLFKKLYRTILLYKAQFISMIFMLALGISVFIGFHIEWISIEYNINQFFEQTGFADYRIHDHLGFQKDIVDKLEQKEGINRVSRFFASNVDVISKEHDTLSLNITEDINVSGFIVNQGKAYDATDTDSIWLSSKYAKENNIHLGDSFRFSLQGKTILTKVAGLIQAGEQMVCVSDPSQVMPDYTSHGFAYISPAAYKKQIGTTYYPSLYICSNLKKSTISNYIEQITGKTLLITDKEDIISYSGPIGECNEGKTMASLMPPIFLIIAFLTMITTMTRLVANEKVQIGTLKALGFKDRKILIHYSSYAAFVGCTGILLGIALGYFIGYMLINPKGTLATYIDMPNWQIQFPYFAIPLLLLLFILLVMIGYISTKKMLKGCAADALRPYTPKAMKSLSIEKTKLFHKLSFGTRWNLRDTMLHKIRTAMSIIGVLGCILILINVLGMNDSVQIYIHNYYQTMNFHSRIFLSNTTSPKQRNDLINQYDGDYSATLGVDYKNKAYPLEIHNSNHHYVSFISRDKKTIYLKQHGAYISTRIADRYHLKKGDIITISQYGTKKKYKLEITDIIRSFNEGIYISDTYAKNLHLSFIPDSIYTNKLKKDISINDHITNVQSISMLTSSFDTFLEIMYLMIAILISIGILLAIVVLYNLGTMMYTERYRELATLKVIGFKDKQLANLLYGQTIWIAIVGLIIGVPLGKFILQVLIYKFGARYEMYTSITNTSIIISIIITFGVSIFVCYLTAKKTKHIDMISSLKGTE